MKRKNFILIIFLSLLCITGCQKQPEDPPQKEIKEELIIESDDTKYVVSISDSSKYIFYYEGDTVTDFEIYIDAKSNENAQKELASYEEIYETEENVEKVKVVDKYIVINYDNKYLENEYDTTSLKEIKKFYE